MKELIALKGIGESFDKEAKRVVKSMPKWKPDEIEGKIVRSRVLITVLFENIE